MYLPRNLSQHVVVSADEEIKIAIFDEKTEPK